MTSLLFTDVTVFDGEAVHSSATIGVRNGLIASDVDAQDAELIDGRGATLLPGLIDAHAHPTSRVHLESAARAGVTTVCDLGSIDLATIAELKREPGLPGILTAGYVASGPGSRFIESIGMPGTSGVAGPLDAARFVADRVADGSDLIKIIIEDPVIPGAKPLSTETVAALAAEAHSAGLIAIAHIVSLRTLRSALDGGVDIVTHTPLNGDIGATMRSLIAAARPAVIPTLCMMDGTASAIGGSLRMRILGALVPAARLKYRFAQSAVRAFRDAGAPVLVGTDASDNASVPFRVPFGASVHDELARLVAAGLSPVDALRGATSTAADVFGLTDRGRIAAGLRADLVLVDGDPTREVSHSRAVRGVWIGGERVFES